MAELTISGLSAGYGEWPVLDDLSLAVASGSVLGIVGPNGAGKTTLLDVIAGRLKVTRGEVTVDGQRWTRLRTYKRVRRGLAYVPEGRGLARELTVAENLRVASRGSRSMSLETISTRAYELFPNLKARENVDAASLSGGEQQMLAITRALTLEPSLLLLDEPTLGLAPIMVRTVGDFIAQAAASGATVVVAEQNVRFVEQVCARVAILRDGRLHDLEASIDGDVHRYLGIESAVEDVG